MPIRSQQPDIVAGRRARLKKWKAGDFLGRAMMDGEGRATLDEQSLRPQLIHIVRVAFLLRAPATLPAAKTNILHTVPCSVSFHAKETF